jgi:hypothetical protein
VESPVRSVDAVREALPPAGLVGARVASAVREFTPGTLRAEHVEFASVVLVGAQVIVCVFVRARLAATLGAYEV